MWWNKDSKAYLKNYFWTLNNVELTKKYALYFVSARHFETEPLYKQKFII